MQKQQHYIPKCYSSNFTNTDGYIYLRDMWEGRTFPIRPADALKQGYIYTQPVHAEARFDNSVENFFSRTVEAAWTPLVRQIEDRKNLDLASWRQLIEFMLAIRVRVPNTMKAVVRVLRERVLTSGRNVPAEGALAELFLKIRPDFTGAPTISDLIEAGVIVTSIDPHRTILSFEKLIRSNKAILSIKGGPKFIHNATRLDFIGSDNPFISHVPSRKILDIQPYSYDDDQNIEIIMPITSRIALIMNTRKTDDKQHFTVTKEETVSAINEKISLYSDRYIFSKNQDSLNAVPNYGHITPTPRPLSAKMDRHGVVHEIDFIFGPPITERNKWKYDFEKS